MRQERGLFPTGRGLPRTTARAGAAFAVACSLAATAGCADAPGPEPTAATASSSGVPAPAAESTPPPVTRTSSAQSVSRPAAGKRPGSGVRTVPTTRLAALLAPAARRDRIPSRGGVRLPPTGNGRLAGTVVVLDPGHNGRQSSRPDVINRLVSYGKGRRKACNTTGTATRNGYPEHAHNWDVATRLAEGLRGSGATVVLTRPSDSGVGPCVDERAAIGNRASADLVVSIHADGNDSPSARGFHIITGRGMAGGARIEATSLAAAGIIRDKFRAGTGLPQSTYTGGRAGITRRDDIAGLVLSKRPAIMIEVGNLRHPSDAALLGDAGFRRREADALTQGIIAALAR